MANYSRAQRWKLSIVLNAAIYVTNNHPVIKTWEVNKAFLKPSKARRRALYILHHCVQKLMQINWHRNQTVKPTASTHVNTAQ